MKRFFKYLVTGSRRDNIMAIRQLKCYVPDLQQTESKSGSYTRRGLLVLGVTIGHANLRLRVISNVKYI